MNPLTRLSGLVILIMLPMVAAEVYSAVDARAIQVQEGKDQALRLAQLVASVHSRAIDGARQLLTAVAKAPVVRDRDASPCSAYFNELVRSYPQYVSLLSADTAGRPVCVGGGTEPLAAVHLTLAIESGGFVVGEDDRSRRKVLYIARQFDGSDGRPAGIVAAGLSLDWLNAELSRAKLPPKATVSLIDRQGTILARYSGGENFAGTKVAGASRSHLLSGGEEVQEALGLDGVAQIYSYAPVPDGAGGLTVSVGLDTGTLFAGAEAANRRDIPAIAGSCILALILAAIGARVLIRRPIKDLQEAAEYRKPGDLGSHPGSALNPMAAAIRLREHELETRLKQRADARHAAEGARYESEKTEIIERLTGGVAHDFNNILAVIVGNLELARVRLGADHAVAKRLDAALQSANRGAGLVHQLLAFARRQTLHPEVVDLNLHIRACRQGATPVALGCHRHDEVIVRDMAGSG